MSSEVSTPTAKRRLGSWRNTSPNKRGERRVRPLAPHGSHINLVPGSATSTHRNNQRYRFKIVMSTSEASLKVIRDKARKLMAELITDPDGFKQAYRASLSVERFIYDDYLPAVQETHRSIRTIKSRIKPIVAALGHKPLNRHS